MDKIAKGYSGGFLWAAVSVLLVVLAAYWWLLLDNQRSQLDYAEKQLELRAQQTSEALATQIQVLVSGLDYLGESLSAQYIESNERFPLAVEKAIAIFEQDIILQVAVADETGNIVYSNLTSDTNTTGTPFSIANREHFLIYAEGRAPATGIYISDPVRGRISGRWSIQLAQPLVRDGTFAGVLVVSISPEFISEYFQKVFPRSGGDVALLLNDRGYYLARSSQQDQVIGSQVSKQLRAGLDSGDARGKYRLQPAWDAVQRDYAWRWVQGYPLAVSVGLDRQAALSPVTDRFVQSRFWNAVSTLVILVSLLLIAILVRRLHTEQQRLAWNEERLTSLLAQVPGAVYQFRRQSDGSSEMLYISPGSTALIGYTPEEIKNNISAIFDTFHPEDRQEVLAAIAVSAENLTPWEIKFRLLLPSGETRWVAGYANPRRESDGSILWHGYVHDISRQHAINDALRDSTARLRTTIDAVHDGLWEWHLSNDTILFDERCQGMLGYPLSDRPVAFAHWYGLVHPNDRPFLDKAINEIHRGELFRLELRLRMASGDWLWTEIRGRAVEGDEGKRVLGTQSDISQRVAEDQLRNALLDNNAAAILLVGPDQQVRLANRRARQLFANGHPLKGMRLGQLQRNETGADNLSAHAGMLRQGKYAVEAEYPFPDANGELHWFSIHGTLLDAERPEGDIIWTLIDITERRQMEVALSATQTRLIEVIRHFPGGVLLESADGEILVANQALCDLFGLEMTPDSLTGTDREQLSHLINLQQVPAPQDERRQNVLGSTSEVVLADGRMLQVDLIPIRIDDTDVGRLWISSDITEWREHERNLERLATTDPLTGLVNRRVLLAEMEAALQRDAPEFAMGALIMLDLDHFKNINDTYGHAAGDSVLVHLASLLRNMLRQGDIAGRLGGEEFAVLLAGAGSESALVIAERLRAAVEQSSIELEGNSIQVTTSIGLAPLIGKVDDVFARADEALYRAKKEGRNRVVMGSPP
ncbi:PAS domain S-box-containing protein/diguanylate cyclase (GGDEF) domain-containing protein [Halopseudomonas litoralis]|uniref:PAS domain S-box-containing protein/diguanylate cyclase (GGDEF) domain-containing protein n=1 Tax=Halopseudomonas litoralis TaxID=797277 RepID=A0A1H1PXB4_9GAMM|nr:diguanylate cyclase [Halopseudomonas litoralis]SDS15818.1 PAS domain S-box-containing protein/diguanylate cyclase (GGDEF) domain-containing protein [Halopseudomonas litoralis]